ncbi:DnaJ domain-containing protein [Chitinophaga costaii]|uniref:DnaJ domain-containing protein n=1 Tax=Chitinophaga costaii TaxID=1335309 RepID=A0A1C4EXB2_9BACT|nr:J domain-containing protein [Chitinophaga costaii]PUZ21580.1 J domain-containing protein [Chitinophaga costaii]SCC48146.1 DnaJ domain-containing protein [Chitinophaga costaii]
MKKGFLEGYKTYDTSHGYGSPKAWRDRFKDRMGAEQAADVFKGEPSQAPYTILGIQPGATQAAIKKAFRKCITEWHPDRNSHRLEEAEERSKKIIAAYTLLSA